MEAQLRGSSAEVHTREGAIPIEGELLELLGGGQREELTLVEEHAGEESPGPGARLVGRVQAAAAAAAVLAVPRRRRRTRRRHPRITAGEGSREAEGRRSGQRSGSSGSKKKRK